MRAFELVPVVFHLPDSFLKSWPLPHRPRYVRQSIKYFTSKPLPDSCSCLGSDLPPWRALFGNDVNAAGQTAIHFQPQLTQYCKLIFPKSRSSDLACTTNTNGQYYPLLDQRIVKVPQDTPIRIKPCLELVFEDPVTNKIFVVSPFEGSPDVSLFKEKKPQSYELKANRFVLPMRLFVGNKGNEVQPKHCIFAYWTGIDQDHVLLPLPQPSPSPDPHYQVYHLELPLGTRMGYLGRRPITYRVQVKDEKDTLIAEFAGDVSFASLEYNLILREETGTNRNYELLWTSSPVCLVANQVLPQPSAISRESKKERENDHTDLIQQVQALELKEDALEQVTNKLQDWLRSLDEIQELKGAGVLLQFLDESLMLIRNSTHVSRLQTYMVISISPIPNVYGEQSVWEKWGGKMVSCGSFSASLGSVVVTAGAAPFGVAMLKTMAVPLAASGILCFSDAKRSMDEDCEQWVECPSGQHYRLGEIVFSLLALGVNPAKLIRSLIPSGIKDITNLLGELLEEKQEVILAYGKRWDSYNHLITLKQALEGEKLAKEKLIKIIQKAEKSGADLLYFRKTLEAGIKKGRTADSAGGVSNDIIGRGLACVLSELGLQLIASSLLGVGDVFNVAELPSLVEKTKLFVSELLLRPASDSTEQTKDWLKKHVQVYIYQEKLRL